MRLPLLALAVLCVPAISLGWSADGHIQVADIAWTKLTPKVQAKMAAILSAGEPMFRPLEGNVRDAFRKSSTWSDVIKGKQDGIYESLIVEMNKRFEPNIESTGNEGNRCKTWHYYDIPIRYKGATPTIRPSNALVALNLAIEELAKINKSPNPDRKMECWWLYWINHIVGDLHQPLHCVSSHGVHPEGDDGGNKFNLKIAGSDRKGRLHGLWDGAIGRAIGQEREAGLSPNVEDVSARWTLDEKLKPVEKVVKDLSVKGWIETGAVLADKVVYEGIEEDTVPSDAYIQKQVELCKKQAVLAGEHLAGVLNKALD